jgi:hypothetical protein
MIDITQMDAELSTLGDIEYSGYNGDNIDCYIIAMRNFIETQENIASFYSIIGKYMPDFSCDHFSLNEGVLRSELNKII